MTSEQNSGTSVQPGGQQGNDSKKAKARGVQLEKENSQSSMESDCRSSLVCVTNNGRESGNLANYKEEYGDDAQYGIHEGDQDALVESTRILHSAQEELEREVQRLRDIGKNDPLFSQDSGQPSESTSSYTLETQTTDLKQNVLHLQSKLEETQVTLELKEAKIFELESSLNLGPINIEIEELLKQRIKAEVEFLVISMTIQNPRTGPIDRIKLNVQQKKLVEASKGQDIVGTEDVSKMRKRAYRFTSYFVLQFMLFLVVVYLFVCSSQTVEVVPT